MKLISLTSKTCLRPPPALSLLALEHVVCAVLFIVQLSMSACGGKTGLVSSGYDLLSQTQREGEGEGEGGLCVSLCLFVCLFVSIGLFVCLFVGREKTSRARGRENQRQVDR